VATPVHLAPEKASPGEEEGEEVPPGVPPPGVPPPGVPPPPRASAADAASSDTASVMLPPRGGAAVPPAPPQMADLERRLAALRKV